MQRYRRYGSIFDSNNNHNHHYTLPFPSLQIFSFACISVFGIIYLAVGVTILLIPDQKKFLIASIYGNICLIVSILCLGSVWSFKTLLDNVRKIVLIIIFFLSMAFVYVAGILFRDPFVCFFFLGTQTLAFILYDVLMISEGIISAETDSLSPESV